MQTKTEDEMFEIEEAALNAVREMHRLYADPEATEADIVAAEAKADETSAALRDAKL